MEAEGKLSGTEYGVEMGRDVLTFYRTRRMGGSLGIGARTVREPVMAITAGDTGAEVSFEPLDPEFVRHLVGVLRGH